MKTILNIGGNAYLLPKTSDLNKILELLEGIQPVRNEMLWGPDKACYAEPYYLSRMVAGAECEISVSRLSDAKAVTEAEWVKVQERHAQACAEFNAKELAQPVSAGS